MSTWFASVTCQLKLVGGFCAEGAGAITLFLLAAHGIPVSTKRIVWAWRLTIPASAVSPRSHSGPFDTMSLPPDRLFCKGPEVYDFCIYRSVGFAPAVSTARICGEGGRS
jgi:hypothetical protein